MEEYSGDATTKGLQDLLNQTEINRYCTIIPA